MGWVWWVSLSGRRWRAPYTPNNLKPQIFPLAGVFKEATKCCSNSCFLLFAAAVTVFPKKLCATTTHRYHLFGSNVTAELCRNGSETHILVNGAPHWCLQDFMNVTQDSNTILLPSRCAVWIKEVENLPIEDIDVIDKAGLKRLGNGTIWHQHQLPAFSDDGVNVEGAATL